MLRVFVALVIQHATHMYRIILSSEACLTVSQFSTLFQKRHDKKVIDRKVCVLIFFTTLYEIFLIPRRIRQDIVINVNSL